MVFRTNNDDKICHRQDLPPSVRSRESLDSPGAIRHSGTQEYYYVRHTPHFAMIVYCFLENTEHTMVAHSSARLLLPSSLTYLQSVTSCDSRSRMEGESL